MKGEMNFRLNGKRCRISYEIRNRGVTVWGEIDRGRRDWDGSVIMDMTIQHPSSYSKNKADPIGEAFDHVHQNLEANSK